MNGHRRFFPNGSFHCSFSFLNETAVQEAPPVRSRFLTSRMAGILLLSACLAVSFLSSSAFAKTETISLHKLGLQALGNQKLADNEALYLPTVRAQHEITFTKPKTWKLSPNSAIQLSFQHSHQLLPDRSWLQVLVNGAVVKHLPLTAANANGTTVKVPLPVSTLKDFNKLAFRVEQHYAKTCEDPLDASLWTQVLPSTQMLLDYQQVLPELSLSSFPYPIIDILSYEPSSIHYVINKATDLQTIKAMAYVNTFFAQASDKKGLKTGLSFTGENAANPEQHLVYVGTPGEIKELSGVSAALQNLPVRLNGTQWVNASGTVLEADAGVIALIRHPKFPEKSLLILSGNSPKGVFKAAQYLTSKPRETALTGQAVQVATGWVPPGNGSSINLRYLNKESRKLSELGYAIQSVEKINAPPITYDVPVVSNFKTEGSKLFFDIVYSYGPGLNPKFSSLELRLNDRSFINLPLLSETGENLKKVTVQIPNDLIGIKNKLVGQFHLMPDKYGFCVDNYEDKAWAKIHNDSEFRIEGPVGSQTPNLALLNEGVGYPYTRSDNLENVRFMLPAGVGNKAVLNSLLAVTSRLGTLSQSQTDLRFELGQGSDIPSDRNTIVFANNTSQLDKLKDSLRLRWPEGKTPYLKEFKVNPETTHQLEDPSNAVPASIQQAVLPGQEEHVVTVLMGQTDSAQTKLAQLFQNATSFEAIPHAFLASVGESANAPLTSLKGISDPDRNTTLTPQSPWAWTVSLFQNMWGMNLLYAVIGIVLLFLIVLPMIIRMFKRNP